MKEKLENRIEELRKENDQTNAMLQSVDIRKSQLIQEILTRNGRILELEEILKDLV